MSHRQLYDPGTPFPQVGTPGEFGRAWIDAMYWNARATYDEMKKDGTLEEAADNVDGETQARMASLMKSKYTVNQILKRPKDWTEEGARATLKSEYRELLMAQLREEWPDPEEESEEEE